MNIKSLSLHPGMLPTCVFQEMHLSHLRLSRQFAVELHEMFHGRIDRLTHEAIAVDLFNGACSREMVTRCCSGSLDGAFDSNTSFAILGALLLRSPIPMTPSRFVKRERIFPAADRQQVLALLYRYGVQCAEGSCCGLARDPLAGAAPDVLIALATA